MNKTKTAGFTLMELMIVVAIIGIIAAIAYPGYQDQVRKGKRSDGLASLMDMMAKQERFYTETNAYTTTLTQLGYTVDVSLKANSNESYYKLSAADCSADSDLSCITLTADPQFDDTLCDNLTYNSKNQKTENGTGAVDNCW